MGIALTATSIAKSTDRAAVRRGAEVVAAISAQPAPTAPPAAASSRATDRWREALHEWRKRTKDLRYEVELLEPVWPQTIKSLAEQAHHLTNLLGEDHDLAVLRTVVQDQAREKPSDGAVDTDSELLLALIDERRTALQEEALELGRKLYEETPANFVDRIKGYWKVSGSP